MTNQVQAYNNIQSPENIAICDQLADHISMKLLEAQNKIWHGAPVWFLNGNPIVGYWVRKNHVQLLFWSGQSFDEPGLAATGTFKAAEARYTAVEQISADDLSRWLEKANKIQWDYKNIVKGKDILERLK